MPVGWACRSLDETLRAILAYIGKPIAIGDIGGNACAGRV